jgi:peptidoglycan/LPS O-acetylase OafA/YrhL
VQPDPRALTPAASPGGQQRLVFVDVLRAAVIAMVVVHHAAMAYGPTSIPWPVHDPAHSDWFVPLLTVDAAVGLALLFLLAAYFVPGSCETKGAGRFLRHRWTRIGVPMVLFALAVNLPVEYAMGSFRSPGEFVRWLHASAWQAAFLHLWFLAHLLVYSAIYVAWRTIASRAGRPGRTWQPPGHGAIVTFVAALALVTWVIRIWYPVGRWVALLFVLPAEPAHLAQYVAMFALGVLAYRGDWLRRMPTRTGMIWLAIGMAAAAGVFAVAGLGWWNDVMTDGGLNSSALARSTWEAVICTGLSIGLIVLFRELVRGAGRLLTALAATSYAAYILHLYLVITLQFEITRLQLPAAAKFAIVAVLGIVAAYGLALLSRAIPGVRVILGTAHAAHTTTRRPSTKVRHQTDLAALPSEGGGRDAA